LLDSSSTRIPVELGSITGVTTESEISPVTASASSAGSARVVFSEEFTTGLHHQDTQPVEERAWLVRPSGPFPYGDGTLRTSSAGLVVESGGLHPETGDPAFAYVSAQVGTDDHLKWSALVRGSARRGFPGFDTTASTATTCSATLSVRTFGTESHPFGSAVTDADADPRLAAGALITADIESGVVFDFLLTNTATYALYERLARPGTDRAAFSYAVPVGRRDKDAWHELAIRYDRSEGVVRWLADGTEVLSVDRIGYRCLDRRLLTIDHGGREEPAAPQQLTVGIAMLVQLDAAGPDGRGLTRLSDQNYLDPRQGGSAPQRFVDERGLVENRLWGQGVRIAARRITVSTEG
jgi:hypothetical protein